MRRLKEAPTLNRCGAQTRSPRNSTWRTTLPRARRDRQEGVDLQQRSLRVFKYRVECCFGFAIVGGGGTHSVLKQEIVYMIRSRKTGLAIALLGVLLCSPL